MGNKQRWVLLPETQITEVENEPAVEVVWFPDDLEDVSPPTFLDVPGFLFTISHYLRGDKQK